MLPWGFSAPAQLRMVFFPYAAGNGGAEDWSSALSMQELLERLSQESSYGMFRFRRQQRSAWHRATQSVRHGRPGLTQDKAVPGLMRRISALRGGAWRQRSGGTGGNAGASTACQPEPYTAAAAERCQRLQRLYVSMGVLCGLLLAILLC